MPTVTIQLADSSDAVEVSVVFDPPLKPGDLDALTQAQALGMGCLTLIREAGEDEPDGE